MAQAEVFIDVKNIDSVKALIEKLVEQNKELRVEVIRLWKSEGDTSKEVDDYLKLYDLQEIDVEKFFEEFEEGGK